MHDHRPTRTPRWAWIGALGAIAVGLGACGPADDGSAPTTTLPTSTTIASLSPEDAFDQALTDQLNGLTPAFISGSRQASQTLCDNLTTSGRASSR